MPRLDICCGLMSRAVLDLERAIEAALRPGDFIDHKQNWVFIEGAERVADGIRQIIGKGQATEAAMLFETFIAAAYEKADEVADSGASFAMFVEELIYDWVRARRAAKANPEETAAILLDWMEGDDYGFCHDLERDLVKVLNKRGLSAFSAQVRERLEASAHDDQGPSGYPRRRWTNVLKHTLAAQGDAEAYIALVEEADIRSKDCSVIAAIYKRCSDLDKALSWVERGLGLASTEQYSGSDEYELKQQLRALLSQLGRTDEAISAAWADFGRRPNNYQIIIELVPDNQRDEWHDKAMAAAEHGELSGVVELFVETGEIERLAAQISAASNEQLEGLSRLIAEPVSELLAEPHPAIAGRVFRALGLRIVNSKKSRHYQVALGNFERARDCYLAAGKSAEWQALVTDVRSQHGRKYTFMPDFNRIAGGGPAIEPRPSFLEQARSRWPRGKK